MSHHIPPRPKRRQFLASLLFGGALTLASLQGAIAAPIEDGWVLPKDLKDRLENPKGSRLDPVPKPQETPPPPPSPPDGRFVPSPPRPPMPGAIRPPSLQNGKVYIPEPSTPPPSP